MTRLVSEVVYRPVAMPDPQPDPPHGATFRLPDGGRVRVRPLRPDDRAALTAGFRRLSDRSRRLRFHAGKGTLSDAELDHLTHLDYVDHFAWAAFDLDDPERPGIGVARYVRLEDEPDVAEPAVTVVDDHQRRGLGSLLFRLLARTAAERGIRRFRAYVMAANLGLFHEMPGVEVKMVSADVAEVEIALPLEGEHAPGPSGLLREVARGVLTVLRRRGPGTERPRISGR